MHYESASHSTAPNLNDAFRVAINQTFDNLIINFIYFSCEHCVRVLA